LTYRTSTLTYSTHIAYNDTCVFKTNEEASTVAETRSDPLDFKATREEGDREKCYIELVIEDRIRRK